LHASSVNFSGKQFTLHAGEYRFSLQLQLPVKKGKYDLQVALQSSGKWIDHWQTSTKILVLDTYESPTIEAFEGILNVKTNFSLEKLSTPFMYTS
jgi:hypothetical protein